MQNTQIRSWKFLSIQKMLAISISTMLLKSAFFFPTGYSSKLGIPVWNLHKLVLIYFKNVSQSIDYTLLITKPVYIPFLQLFSQIEFTYHKINPFKVYNAVTFSIFTNLCTHHNDLILEQVIILQRNLILFGSHSPFISSSEPLLTTNITFGLSGFVFPDIFI